VWVDGIHFKVRLDQDRVCTLVIIGARADGNKELVALSDGHRESTESWADLLREGKRRGMLGFWAALREVFPQTREQRGWVHKTANVLDALPTSAHPAARKALAEIRDAEDRQHAQKAITALANLFGTKHPKAVAKIVDDTEQLLAFYDFPAEHWVHLKTSNPMVILSSGNDHCCGLLLRDVDGVVDAGAQQGSMIEEIRLLGVSQWLPRIAAARCSPRASARASRSRLLSTSRWRMWVVATSSRWRREASDARCRSGTSRCRTGCWRCRRRSISARRSGWL
jgi:hypothetical protein